MLTEREREVVVLAARGLDNAEIADELVISPATARIHISRAMTKLDVRDRTQLVVLAYQTGLSASTTVDTLLQALALEIRIDGRDRVLPTFRVPFTLGEDTVRTLVDSVGPTGFEPVTSRV